MSKDNGEPAFPVSANEYGGHGTCFGITVRDYFAAKALQGMLAGDAEWIASEDVAATRAYKMADAMLAARSA